MTFILKMLSISCLPAASLFGWEPPHLFNWCLSTSQNTSDVQLFNLIKSLFSPPYSSPALLLCDVVAQTVKVNHSGLHINIREKNKSVCLCRCTKLLSKQNHLKKKIKREKAKAYVFGFISSTKSNDGCALVSWAPPLICLHPFLCLYLLVKGEGLSFCPTLIGWEWEKQTKPREIFLRNMLCVVYRKVLFDVHRFLRARISSLFCTCVEEKYKCESDMKL